MHTNESQTGKLGRPFILLVTILNQKWYLKENSVDAESVLTTLINPIKQVNRSGMLVYVLFIKPVSHNIKMLLKEFLHLNIYWKYAHKE